MNHMAGQKSLYDSYIRAFRWASDRISEKGVIGFVTNAGWIDGNSTDGFRSCLCREFSKIYIYHLGGNARTSGEKRKKEGKSGEDGRSGGVETNQTIESISDSINRMIAAGGPKVYQNLF